MKEVGGMAYRIAICDDDGAQSEYIKNLVTAWASGADVTAHVSVFHAGQALLFAGCDAFDIFLLDIEMPGISGIDLAKTLREQNDTAVIVFITGYADYIAEGYDVSALHYLMKPLDKEKLFSVLDKARHVLGKREACLLLESGKETHRIPLKEIRYIEVSANYVTVHASDDVTAKKTLSEVETQLDERFARAGRSFVVNLSYVRRVTKHEVVLSTDERVPLSRGMYEPLNRAIIERM